METVWNRAGTFKKYFKTYFSLTKDFSGVLCATFSEEILSSSDRSVLFQMVSPL